MVKWLHTIRHLFEHRAAVLMYHRVADVAVDPWELAVSPKNFEEQIQLLTKNFHVIPVPELLTNLQQKKLAANSVCVTFDDGYADNYLFAKPLLERYKCPATFFIPSHFTGQQQPFWWDELQAVLLSAPQLPQLFQMSIQDEAIRFDLGDDSASTGEQEQKHQAWAWPAEPPTQRCVLYIKIWEQLKPLPYAEIQNALTEIKIWAGYSPVFPEALLPMHGEQVAHLSQNPLFDIGLHTATHPALAYHPEEMQYGELAENKKALQKFEPINVVAFPYGNYNNSTLSVLRKQRIAASFTTEERKLTTKANPLCLGRFQVKNQDGNSFEKQLLKWLKA